MTIVDILRRAKVDITVASVEKSVQILASQGTKIIADKLIGVAAKSTYDLIVLPVRQSKYTLIQLFFVCALNNLSESRDHIVVHK